MGRPQTARPRHDAAPLATDEPEHPGVPATFDETATDWVLDSAENDDSRGVWSEYATLTDSSAPTLFERINQAQSVLAILRACLPADRQLEELEQALMVAADRVAMLAVLTPGSAGHDEHAAEIAADLGRTETRLLERERKVPLSWLRHQSEAYDFGDASFVHYVRFQLQYLRETPECWSRIDLLITLLARRRDPDGSVSVRPAEEVAALWSAFLPPSDTEAAVRKAAIRFFGRALSRLGELGDLDDLFTTGYYIDILGYKLSLRRDYFDPPILHAAAELNVAMESWLEAHQGRSMRAVDKQFAEAHATVRKIFLAQRHDPAALAATWTRMFGPDSDGAAAPARAATARPTASPARRLPLRKLLAAAVLLCALALGAPALLDSLRESSRDLRPVSTFAAQTIHPLLTRASYSGDPPQLMVGELDESAWLSLSSREREAEAEALLAGIQRRGVTSALIYRQQALAIHIVGGEVRFIE